MIISNQLEKPNPEHPWPSCCWSPEGRLDQILLGGVGGAGEASGPEGQEGAQSVHPFYSEAPEMLIPSAGTGEYSFVQGIVLVLGTQQ